MVKLYKDILIKIFFYLPAKDIISCSLVDHKFYEASSDNHLWFELLRFEGKKYLKDSKSVCYDDKINYKLYYLSLFNQKYHLQIFNFYREIRLMASFDGNVFDKSLIYFVYLTGGILFIPLIIGIEIYECISHRKKKYEYCSCDSCYKKISMKVRSKYNI